MNLAIDFTAGVRQPAGVGRYTRSLIGALAHLPDCAHRITLLWAGPARVPVPTEWPHTRSRRLPLPERWMTIAWQRVRLPLPADVLAGGADVFYSPDFALPPLARARSVVTVHDLSFLTHPQTHFPPLRAYLERAVPGAVRRADRVLADSEQTKRDLQSFYAVPAEKIAVVHAAADPTFRRVEDDARRREALKRRGIDRPYLFSVGTIQPRKNLPVLFDVLRQLPDDVILVHAGRPGWLYEPIFDALERSGVKDRVRFVEGAGDTEVAALYSGALAFVFPSLYEGFGMPCLEAMACGTPVIASNAGSVPEVVGDAGILVDPMDSAGIADGIRRLADDHGFRRSLVERGHAHVGRFSWEASARQLRSLLESVAGNN
ncbi:MAG: glycosyltransferase family 4 protein [Chloroflexi bacterium]|nr:glycosyltransferase family 4 protein [Chloroflexota bacterium]